ncbi:type 4b pilus protein PilO2 [Rhodanobacter sp. 115]|uniref:type 4b pilus protein PilO2 n=1 Tax=Rhodanobacter sp. FW021-MT20 TaxID=1162282 RepID=UPI0034E387F3
MRIETVGKRHYAFGLTWADSSRKPGKAELQALRKQLDPTGRARYYTCTCHTGNRFVLAGGINTTRVRGKIYSFAASLAARQPDGLYVVQVDADNLWFVLIRNGLVIPETDVIDTTEKVLRSIEFYRRTLNLDASSIFAGDGVEIVDAQLFNAEQAVLGLRNPVALRLVSSKPAMMPLAIGVVGLVLVGAGVKLYRKHKAAQSQQQLTEQQRLQKIQAYRQAAQGALSNYARDPQWITRALEKARNRLPPFLAGWTLQKVDCDLSGCNGDYVHGTGLVFYAVAPFQARFRGQLSIHPDSNGLRVHVPLSVPVVVASDSLLHNPPPVSNPSLIDWIGLSPLHVAGLSDRPAGVAKNLALAAGATTVGYPSFVTETVLLKGNAPIAVSLPSVLHWASPAGFRVTHLTWMTGYGSSAAESWQITAMRFHR